MGSLELAARVQNAARDQNGTSKGTSNGRRVTFAFGFRILENEPRHSPLRREARDCTDDHAATRA